MNLRSRRLVRTVQIILGLYLVVVAVGSFLQFFPTPEFNESASAFLGALFATGYILPVMWIIFIPRDWHLFLTNGLLSERFCWRHSL